ncbi:MAG: hypothetical protein RMK80_06525 [Pseudobdellovibrionaceae bacterium]|nr:hypothetical protein [Pseudobdellovibrionaceae bacterium]
MTQRRLLTLLCSVALLALTQGLNSAQASENTAYSGSSNASAASNTAPAEAANDQNENNISNPRLSAAAGGRSKFSFYSVFSYLGGSISNPLSSERPNYRGLDQNQMEYTSLVGSLGIGYRINPAMQARLTTGFEWVMPLHNSLEDTRRNETNYQGNRVRIFNVSGISTSLNYTTQTEKRIHATEVGLSLPTTSYWRDIVGLVGTVSLEHTLIGSFESGFQPGVTLYIDHSGYVNDNPLDNQNRVRVQNYLGAYPFVEYQVNDTYGFRAVFGFFEYTRFVGKALSDFERMSSYISMGVNIAPSKEIWLYPNVQFAPEMATWNNTNVGISMILNL